VASLAVAAAILGPASVVLAAAPSPAPTALAAGGIGLRLVDVPVSASDDPRAQLYIVEHLAPGTVIERRIEVSNTSFRRACRPVCSGGDDRTRLVPRLGR